MYFEEVHLRGEWDWGYALSYHNLAYRGEVTRRSRIARMYDLSKTSKVIFDKLVSIAVDQIQPRFINYYGGYDFIMPVPHSNTKGPAGPGDFNYEFAKILCERAGVNFFNGFFSTRNACSLQYVKDPKARELMRKGLYGVVNASLLHGARVLVFDDVYNTGATLNEAIKTLRSVTDAVKLDVLTLTAVGGVKKHTTLAEEAREELMEIFDNCYVGDERGAYLGDGMWISHEGDLYE